MQTEDHCVVGAFASHSARCAILGIASPRVRTDAWVRPIFDMRNGCASRKRDAMRVDVILRASSDMPLVADHVQQAR